MNCCECNKILDEKDESIPKKWFGKFDGWKVFKLICCECIKDPEKLARWRKPKRIKG